MNQSKKINFSIGGSIGSSFSNSIGGAIKRLDHLSRKEEDLRSKQTLIGKFYNDQRASGRLADTLRTQKASLADLQASYNSTGGSSEKLRHKIDTLKGNILETTKELRNQKNASRAGATALKKAGIDTNNLRHEEKRLSDELARTEKRLQNRSRNFRAIGSSSIFLAKSFAAVGAAAIGATATAFKLTNSFAEHGDQVAKTADKLGISTNALQELRYSAERAGMSTDELDKSLEFMQKNTVDAANGTGEAKKAFDALGLSAAELKELKPEESLRLIADKLKNVENGQERVRYATQIFGRSGTGMINMLKNGSAGLDELATSAYHAGYVLGEDGLRAAEDYKDAYLDMSMSIKGVAFTLGKALLPTFTKTFRNITNWLSENRETVRGWGETAKTVFSAIGTFVVGAGKIVHSFFSTLWSVGETLGGWTYETVQFFSNFGENVSNIWNSLTDTIINSSLVSGLFAIKDGAVNAFNSILDIFSSSFDWISKKFSWLTDSLNWLADKAGGIWDWFTGSDSNKEVNINKNSRITAIAEKIDNQKAQRPQFATMSDVAKQAREQRANNVTNANKTNNVQLHNTITIQGNANPKEMEEAIRRATMPLYGNALVGW
ncbi:hypothetical protein [Francisella hispaniensis]|uniref:Phage tail length tape-measure protein n=1 Tax=Francisella hispaniensis TaxID=622488 RepID=F4BFP9_9GAMM|nr:hypothetical protein [Francisella hispaniensis]AEE26293.1 hypothetical protein FN3523_0990 [Francisella hispaniensis]